MNMTKRGFLMRSLLEVGTKSGKTMRFCEDLGAFWKSVPVSLASGYQ